MKAGSRPQYYRIRRMVQMVREGAETGYLAALPGLWGDLFFVASFESAPG